MKFKEPSHMATVSSFVKAQAAQASQATLASVSSSQGISPEAVSYGVDKTFNSTFLNAMSVTLSSDDIEEVKKRYGEKIEYIEPDQLGYAEGMQQGAPWGIVRVGQWGAARGNTYQYPDTAGQGVDVYVLDSGLVASHPSFEGRAKFVRNFVPRSSNGDVIGHGTHVAGTIGSSKYGVAKKANIYSLKVLGDDGNGPYSSIIAAIQFVTGRAKPGKTIINMSLAGGASRALNDAVAAARKAGVVVVVAAGNEHQNACNVSPASSPHVLTVGATDNRDNTASFSNWGKCVDVFAPGVSITSLGKRGNDDTAVMQGTSMAAPHVAGVVALYMSMKSYNNADDVVRDVLGWSHRCVRGAAQGSSRGLVYANANLK